MAVPLFDLGDLNILGIVAMVLIIFIIIAFNLVAYAGFFTGQCKNVFISGTTNFEIPIGGSWIQ